MVWTGMLKRCYCPKYLSKYPTYSGCQASENFKNFQYFAGRHNIDDLDDVVKSGSYDRLSGRERDFTYKIEELETEVARLEKRYYSTLKSR